MQVLTWPSAAYCPRSEDWHLVGRSAATQGVLGRSSIISIENRVWNVTIDVRSLAQSEWRELRAIFDRSRGPFGIHAIPVRQGLSLPVEKSVQFGDGTGWAGGGGWSSGGVGQVTIVEDAVAGARLLRLSGNAALLLPVATMFEVPTGRVYRTVGRVGDRVEIEPPLRAAVGAGMRVELVEPRAHMRLTSDAQSLSRLRTNRSAPVQIRMVEAI